MGKNTEVVAGEIVAESRVIRIPRRLDKEDSQLLALQLDYLIEKVFLLSEGFSYEDASEGQFHLIWSPLDEDDRIQSLLADHFNGKFKP